MRIEFFASEAMYTNGTLDGEAVENVVLDVPGDTVQLTYHELRAGADAVVIARFDGDHWKLVDDFPVTRAAYADGTAAESVSTKGLIFSDVLLVA